MGDFWSDEELRKRMQQAWKHGREGGTVCGRGACLGNTAAVRAWLPLVCQQYGIRSVCDAGAGDLHWIQHVQWPDDPEHAVQCAAFDLIPRHPAVTAFDITRDPLPPCDLILCRMVLIHFDPPRIDRALALFRQSGRYLAATQYDNPGKFGQGSPFNKFDLRVRLGEPLKAVIDGDEDCKLALWDLKPEVCNPESG